MIQISSHLIRSSHRRQSFDEADFHKESAIEKMMSSSPDRLEEINALEDHKSAEPRFSLYEPAPVDKAGESPERNDFEDFDEPESDSKAPEPEQKGRTKMVKFGVSKPSAKGPIAAASAPAASVFTKEQVEKKDLPFSLMTKGLLESGVLRSQHSSAGKASRTQNNFVLKVFTEIDARPVKLTVNDLCKVIDVIEMAIEKHNAEKKDSPITAHASNFELRMLDDDDGSPDFDMAPLENARYIGKYGVGAVALVKKTGAESSERMKINEISASPSDEKSARFFVKVNTEEKVSYVLKATKDMAIQDLLPLLAKKKQVDNSELKPELFNLVYMKTPEMDPLDMNTKVAALESDNLLLLRKVKSIEISASLLIPSVQSASEPHQFMFTPETAIAYSEYTVVKTNTRGKKQQRILGVDAQNVYNKQHPSAAKKDFAKVAHPFRAISTVVECEVSKDDPQTFTISFRDPASGLIKVLQYQTETKMECAEIVAKVNFLRQNPIKS